MASDATERLFREADTQLATQSARAEALATRSGTLVAAIAVAASLLAAVTDDDARGGWLWGAFVFLGASAVTGILVLCMARLAPGPAATQLVRWAGTSDGDILGDLFAVKVLTVEANRAVLARVELMFYTQAVLAAVATGVTLFVVGKS
ncbi:hypothetical protein [Jiangella asiatica]|uniref:Integral membrane plasmid transfer protein n=1 Tax=Jiangella asiatica TaxID=2530372 RepID=A0A4R5D4X3_9ACTN|nr:hypothetical protein [Jiangella asiatica]TDE08376.1 hypothetical protein E1269_17900 [Jiangella asiatica]